MGRGAWWRGLRDGAAATNAVGVSKSYGICRITQWQYIPPSRSGHCRLSSGGKEGDGSQTKWSSEPSLKEKTTRKRCLMRMLVVLFVLTAALFNIPISAHARIAMNRARIVSITVIEDDKKGVLVGNIVVERGSLLAKKSDRVSAKITSNTSLVGDPSRQAPKFSDLKPGMAIEIVIVGRRGGTDQEWEVRSIRLITPPDQLKP